MPHLSPLNWIFTPALLIILLSMIVTILWWQYLPKFPPLSSSSVMKSFNSWPWYWNGRVY